MIESLSLEPSQRREMDGLLERFRSQQQESQAAVAENQRRFFEALEAADLDRARAQNRELVEQLRSTSVAQRQLKVDVLALLTAEQFARLRSQHPHLLRQAWFRRLKMGTAKR